MMTQPSEEQGNLNQALAADIENVLADPTSQSGGASEIPECIYRTLIQAAFRGDWETAERFFKRDAASRTAEITSRSERVLHIAAWSAQDKFLEKLVKHLRSEELEEVDCDGRTALHIAVLCGRIKMVKALVRRNPRLTQLADNKQRIPLGISALEASRHKEIAWYLAKKTTNDGPSQPFSIPSVFDIITALSSAGHHDITLYLVWRYEQFLTMRGDPYKNLLTMRSTRGNKTLLGVLVRNESHFRSGTRLSVMEALIYKCIPVDLNFKRKDENSDPALQYLTRSLWNAANTVPIIKRIHEVKLRHVAAVKLAKSVCIAFSHQTSTQIAELLHHKSTMLQATKRGITEIVKLCIQNFPELIWIPTSEITKKPDEMWTSQTVKCRQERTLSFFLKVSSTNGLSLVAGPTKEESKEMMKEAAYYATAEYQPKNYVAGAAFQMQREIQWFKAVESWVHPRVASGYVDGKLYWNMFVMNHKELIEKGEKWVKDTSNSCMLVSTLIATVLFAAAFTVPGGNDDKTGAPLFLGQDSFHIFVISDALGLFSSVTAILLFLAILTSRYEVQDFLHSLPKKIIMGLSLLFLSLAFMLVAFATTLTMVLDKRLEWALTPVILLASVPVALFAVLQLTLLFQMAKSTYGPSIFRSEGIWDGVKYTKQD